MARSPGPLLVVAVVAVVVVVIAPFVGAGCSSLPAAMGGEPTREVFTPGPRADDVAVPEGYRVELVARGLTFPTGVTFDDDGTPYVVESGYARGEVFEKARLVRVTADGVEEIASAAGAGWMGVTYAQGAFFVAEAGILGPGRILRIETDGTIRALADGLPSLGDHHVNGPVVDKGLVVFGVGTATNAGIVGEDNADSGWLLRFPEFHDVPCEDVTLSGVNRATKNALTDRPDDELATGPYLPFGHRARAGQVVSGEVPCSGAVLRVPVDGGPVELVAWGFRNPFGLAVAPDGRLFVTDSGFDERGGRPIHGAPDVLWEVEPGAWYGWPDYAAGVPVSDERYGSLVARRQPPLLAHPPGEPPPPTALLGVHASSNGFDFSRSEAFGHVGDAFVAQFGVEAPLFGVVWGSPGFKVVRVELDRGTVHDFATNKTGFLGPLSIEERQGLERPVAARFDPTGEALYIVDFGVLKMAGGQPVPAKATGSLWRVTREPAPVAREEGRRPGAAAPGAATAVVSERRNP